MDWEVRSKLNEGAKTIGGLLLGIVVSMVSGYDQLIMNTRESVRIEISIEVF